jgi:hypothetical protein
MTDINLLTGRPQTSVSADIEFAEAALSANGIDPLSGRFRASRGFGKTMASPAWKAYEAWCGERGLDYSLPASEDSWASIMQYLEERNGGLV